MAAKKPKFYVVWEGHTPGVYHTWADCQRQTSGYADAKFRSFESLAEAEQAYANPESIAPKKKKAMNYVVWGGHHTGVYTDWDEVKEVIQSPGSVKYKAFGSRALAKQALKDGPEAYEGRGFKKTRDLSDAELERIGQPNPSTISVDAASNATNGRWEYRGVITDSGTELFRVGPHPEGSNNIGEFLALVHGLAWLKEQPSDIAIYSDSRIAMSWVKQKKAKPKKAGIKSRQLIARAEAWLRANTHSNPILKWETKVWGEIPADFGRK